MENDGPATNMVMAQKSSRSFKKSHVRYNSKIWFGKEQDLEEYPSVQMHASKVNKTLQDVSFPSPHSKKPCFIKALNISFSNLECRCCKKKSSTINGSCVTNGSHKSHYTAVLRNSRFTCTRRWISVYLKCCLYFCSSHPKKKRSLQSASYEKKSLGSRGNVNIFVKFWNTSTDTSCMRKILPRFPVAWS